MRPLRLALSCAALAMPLALSACDADDGSKNSYELRYAPGNYTFTGDNARCRINTSFPDGHPLAGKFFAGVTKDDSASYGALVLTIHWTNLTAAPTAGTYAAEELDFSANLTLTDGTQVAASDGSGSLVVTTDGDALRIEIPDTYQVHGHINCVPF